MKKLFLSIILYIERFGMSFVYFFIKFFPIQKNKITMLSRQSNDINIDFKMLLDEFSNQDKNIKVKVLCKEVPKNIIGRIKYCFFLIICLYHISTSKVCIIDGYSIPISCLKHKKDLKIIQIWHSLGAIKQFGKQVIGKKEGSKSEISKIMKIHQNYDYVLCASDATREFYKQGFGVDESKILKLGMPRIDYLLGKDEKINKKIENLYKDYPNLKEKKTILYVPTFRQGKSVHIYDLINSVNTDEYNLIIKLHPLDKTIVDSKYTINNKYSTFDLLKIADYVITDYSALSLETSILDNKQLYFYLYDIEDYKMDRGLNVNLREEMPNYTFSNIDDIIKNIQEDNYNFEELKKFRDKYVQTVDTNNSKRIVEFTKKLMEE